MSLPDSPAAALSPLSVTDILSATNPRVLVAAHRGVWSSAPENSINAIEHAIAQGADIVELDVRATRDEVLVLLHDETLDRTTIGTGPLAAHDFKQLRGWPLKASDGRTPDWGAIEWDACLPTLASALEAARDRIVVNIDTKDDALTERVAQFVVAAGMADQVFVKADIETQEDLQRVRASPFFGRVAFVPMMRARPGLFQRDLRALEQLGCQMYEVQFSDVAHLEEGREELRRQGARLWVNTIEASHSLDFNDARAATDPDAVWGRLLRAGVGAIQTDAVTPLVRYLAGQGRR